MELSHLLAFVANVLFWFYSSTMLAASSHSFNQRLGVTHLAEQVFTMIFVSLLQMIAGSVLGFLLSVTFNLCCYKLRMENQTSFQFNKNEKQKQAAVDSLKTPPNQKKLSFTVMQLLFPGFHVMGSVFTNLGYSFSSVSCIQAAKLIEPILTIVIDTALRKVYSIPRQSINISSVLCFVLGTGFVFFGQIDVSSLFYLYTSSSVITLVVFSIGFIATRNVLKKIIHEGDIHDNYLHRKRRVSNASEDYTDTNTATNTHTNANTNTIRSKIMETLSDFMYLSISGTIILFPIASWAAVYCVISGTDVDVMIHISYFIMSSSFMIISHPIYNITSLLALSFVTAPIHALLNSGEQLFSTLLLMCLFHQTITLEIIIGMLFIVIAVFSSSSLTNIHRYLLIISIITLYFHFATSTKSLKPLYNIMNPYSVFDSHIHIQPSKHCHVQFINKQMRICHFIPYSGNFGDELGPAVILKLLENKFGCYVDKVPILNLAVKERGNDEICLFNLGSIFHMVKSGDHIWGTGINPNILNQYNTMTNLTFYSVRGPKSEKLVRKYLHVSSPIGHGDPGFLIPFLYPEYRNRNTASGKMMRTSIPTASMPIPTSIHMKNNNNTNDANNSSSLRICFVPHAQDMMYPELKLLATKDLVLVKNSWRMVLDTLKDCDYIASSSLHGIVAADSMGIPSCWFQFNGSTTSRTEGLFKYLDYYATINRKHQIPLSQFNQIFNVNVYHRPLPLRDRINIAKRTIASFPYKLFTKELKLKTLVIIMGTLRGGELAWSSFYKNMIQPNNADLALMIPKNISRSLSSLFNHSKYIWTHDEYEDWGVAIDEAIGGNGEWRKMAAFYNSTGLFGGTKEGGKGSGAIVLLIRFYIRQILIRDNLLNKYDRFVLTRSDHYYSCIHDLDELDPQYLWVPNGEDYSGITDRHVVMNRKQVLKVLNILPPIILKPKQYMYKVLNPEILIKQRWIEEGLWSSVRRFDRMMFTCAVPGDISRWKSHSNSVLTSEGVYLKYKHEYDDAKTTCSKMLLK